MWIDSLRDEKMETSLVLTVNFDDLEYLLLLFLAKNKAV